MEWMIRKQGVESRSASAISSTDCRRPRLSSTFAFSLQAELGPSIGLCSQLTYRRQRLLLCRNGSREHSSWTHEQIGVAPGRGSPSIAARRFMKLAERQGAIIPRPLSLLIFDSYQPSTLHHDKALSNLLYALLHRSALPLPRYQSRRCSCCSYSRRWSRLP